MSWQLVLAGALVAVLVGSVMAAMLFRRRRLRARGAEVTQRVAPVPDVVFESYPPPETVGSVWPSTQGGQTQPRAGAEATPRVELQSTSPAVTVGVSFESLSRRPQDEEAARRMDPRETVAVAQRTRISDTELDWRRTSRARVRESVDGGEALLFDSAIRRTSAEAGFGSLVQREADVRAGVGTDVEVIELAWPNEPLLDYDGGVNGYFAPALDGAFVVDVPRRGRAVRTLGTAIGLSDAQLEALAPEELLELLRLVAVWLAALHEAGVIFGDFGLRSIAYATRPVRIRVLDYDTARPIGRGPLLPPDPEGDRDPLAPMGESSYDSDRFLFAQVAFRLLVARTQDGPITPEAIPSQIPGLDPQCAERLRTLWRRAAGPWGTRPTMEEWVAVLQHPGRKPGGIISD